MRVLVTNDDGYAAPGFTAMLRAVRLLGWTPYPVAPEGAMSGASRSRRSGVTYEVTRREVEGVEVVCVDGSPATCVVVGLTSGLIPEVDLCVSGVNAGENLGSALSVSGTFGAALEARSYQVRGVALSRQYGGDLGSDPNGWEWEGIAEACAAALEWTMRREDWTVANINIPNAHDPAEAPVTGDVSAVSYFTDVFNPSTSQIESRLEFDRHALRPTDDITHFALEGRVSVTFPAGY
ncbi:MAG TPA: 5'/3'-nucleotidase SurE [Nocardioides sp.]|uniref:5'/3'-nucleotidase SurE n=1 Tax=Nocardioides sp. TaxID=35761 RepID=UPI002BD49039|nr:5'/3'-nucleotidase SurE [Nocardioides sp.]HTW14759.1 5'/3'-nucleotidase SurE [Nocardioides sp.]